MGHTGGMAKGRRARRSTFVELVEQVDPAQWAEAGQPWPRPIKDGYWIDPEGVRWLVRGTTATMTRIRQLRRDPDVRALLFYGSGAPQEIGVADRDELWGGYAPTTPGGSAVVLVTGRTSISGSSKTTSISPFLLSRSPASC